jgi:hypothetical protein
MIAGSALAALAIVASRSDRPAPRTASTQSIHRRYAAPLGDVRPVGVARYERVSAAPDEAVRLTEGRIHVAVVHLGPQERFRVLTADSSVEVRGTEFELEASAGRLQSVEVERGLVEVRVANREAQLLIAGAHWQAASEPPLPRRPQRQPRVRPATLPASTRARPPTITGRHRWPCHPSAERQRHPRLQARRPRWNQRPRPPRFPRPQKRPPHPSRSQQPPTSTRVVSSEKSAARNDGRSEKNDGASASSTVGKASPSARPSLPTSYLWPR